MLTRLKVKGFKNLVDVDVHFGPFTCLAGPNASGKSNLFDAVSFLGNLAHGTLLEAALAVRNEGGSTFDVRSLFHRFGSTTTQMMSFEAEMIIPPSGVDDLGQSAEASITFLRYKLALQLRGNHEESQLGPLEIVHEELTHIKKGDAREHLKFPHKRVWRDTAILGARRVPYFISTEGDDEERRIRLHQEGTGGKPRELRAKTLPKTVLSSATAAEARTVLLARREMESWRMLQFEPSALRTPDPFHAPAHIGMDGSHLASTLQRLSGEAVYSSVANRLSELIDDVREVTVDRDERREILTLQVIDRSGTPHAARALSDGTLRFLALAILELDVESGGMLCFEEPENGLHPTRIPTMLGLLGDLATDPLDPVGRDNPLRQVIINTHSPSVVAQVPDDTLLGATLQEVVSDSGVFKQVVFNCLQDTWRADEHVMPTMPKGTLLAYLLPLDDPAGHGDVMSTERPRVIDRPDFQQLFLPSLGE